MVLYDGSQTKVLFEELFMLAVFFPGRNISFHFDYDESSVKKT